MKKKAGGWIYDLPQVEFLLTWRNKFRTASVQNNNATSLTNALTKCSEVEGPQWQCVSDCPPIHLKEWSQFGEENRLDSWVPSRSIICSPTLHSWTWISTYPSSHEEIQSELESYKSLGQGVMTSDSSNWSTLCMVGLSSGLVETHWIAIPSRASRLSVCTPSHCGSTISRCLFSGRSKFNCQGKWITTTPILITITHAHARM